jgi:ferredoxin
VSYRVDPAVPDELALYGGDTATKCFNCGNCSAACSLTDQDSVFPRRYIRYIQLGLRDKMLSSLDPWLCYYCGDCSDTCPREAQPGQLMMASRRWLISMYDWTGLSRLLYRRESFEIVFLALVAAVVLALFVLPANFGFNLLAAHPEARQHVDLRYFAPKETVHIGDMLLVVVLGGLLLSNAARMFWLVRHNAPAIPLRHYIAGLGEFIVQMSTQKHWRQCGASTAGRHWLRHFLLVLSYGVMFTLVVVFLYWFQVEDASFHWTAIPGYIATLGLLGATLTIIHDRRRRRDQIHRVSDLADWLFVSLLFLTALTGILLHGSRMLDLPMPTYLFYVVHLMVAVPMLVVEVPFGKWSHLLYRPFALYLVAVQHRAAVARPEQQPAGSPLPRPV